MNLSIELFRGLGPKSELQFYRLVICLLASFLLRDTDSLMSLPRDLSHQFGIFSLIPGQAWGLYEGKVVVGLKLLAFTALLLASLSLRAQRYFLAAGVCLVLLNLAFEKSFGGHWDHRELTVIYVATLFAIVGVPKSKRPIQPVEHEHSLQLRMLLIASPIIIQYVFVGVARLSFGIPSVFEGDSLYSWILNRQSRSNLGLGLFDITQLNEGLVPLLDAAFFAATLVEVAAILLYWARSRTQRITIAGFLALMHVGIWLTLSIPFPENMLLLIIFCYRDKATSRNRAEAIYS